MSLDRMVVDTGKNEQTDCLTFTALTRGRDFNRIMLQEFDVAHSSASAPRRPGDIGCEPRSI